MNSISGQETSTKFSTKNQTIINILLVPIILSFLVLLSIKLITFGSKKGGWVYPYRHGLDIKLIFLFILFIVIIPCILLLIKLSYRAIRNHEIEIVILWFLIGFVSQIAFFQLCQISIGEIIESDVSTSFYSVAQNHTVETLLENYDDLSKTLPLHAKSNMIGKILLFKLLRRLSSSPKVIGYLLILISCLGSLLVYFISKIYFKDRLVALYSLILYLFIPARVFFSATLNSLSPIFVLLSFLLLLLYMEHSRVWYLLLFGFSLYVVFIFEPLLLALGVMFVAVVLVNYLRRQILGIDLVKIASSGILIFALTHILLLRIFHYNAINNFIFVFRDAAEFNTRSGVNRSYTIWVFQNLQDFFVNAGVIQSTIFLLFVVIILYQFASIVIKEHGNKLMKLYHQLLDPGTFFTMAFFLNLIIVDIIGINRGEIIRLWIFLMVFIQIIVAYACVKKLNRLSFAIVLLSSILQILATMRLVSFVWTT